MKKTCGIILISLITLLALMPFFTGLFIQKYYETALNNIAHHLKLETRLINYQRGWLKSSATFAVNFPLTDTSLPKNLNRTNALFIHQTLLHGPIIFTHHALPQLRLVTVQSFLEGSPFAVSTLTFNKRLITLLSLKQYTAADNQAPIYTIKGLAGYIYEDLSHNDTFVTIKLQHLKFHPKNVREIKNFTTVQSFRVNESGLWVANKTFDFGSLLFNEGGKPLCFRNFKTVLNTEASDHVIKINLTSRIDAALSNKTNYGTQECSLEIKGLTDSAFEQLRDLVISVDQSPPLVNVLNQGASVNLKKLSLNTAWGPINLEGSLGCPCDKKDSNLAHVLSRSQGFIKGYLPIKFAHNVLEDYYLRRQNHTDIDAAKRDSEKTLVDWQKMGWLTTTGTTFNIDLNWK